MALSPIIDLARQYEHSDKLNMFQGSCTSDWKPCLRYWWCNYSNTRWKIWAKTEFARRRQVVTWKYGEYTSAVEDPPSLDWAHLAIACVLQVKLSRKRSHPVYIDISVLRLQNLFLSNTALFCPIWKEPGAESLNFISKSDWYKLLLLRCTPSKNLLSKDKHTTSPNIIFLVSLNITPWKTLQTTREDFGALFGIFYTIRDGNDLHQANWSWAISLHFGQCLMLMLLRNAPKS